MWIQFSTDYLERKVSLIRDDMIKAPGSRDLAIAIDKTNARLAHEIRLEFIHHPPNPREANSKTEEVTPRHAPAEIFLALEEEDLVPKTSEPSGCSGSSRAAPDDDSRRANYFRS